MRTVRLLTVSHSIPRGVGVYIQGGSASEGDMHPGGSPSMGALRRVSSHGGLWADPLDADPPRSAYRWGVRQTPAPLDADPRCRYWEAPGAWAPA